MRIKGAIFDFDGTLFDSMYIWDTAGETYLASIGVAPRPGVNEAVCALSLSQTASYFKSEYDLEMTTAEIEEGINKMVRHFYYDLVQPKPGVREFLDLLQCNGVKRAVATASEHDHVLAALRRCDMEKYFDGILTCAEVGSGKDEPEIFRACLNALGTAKSETAVFEDAIHAARTAKRDGFVIVGVYDKSEKRAEELKALSDCYITDFCKPETFLCFASD